MIPPAVIEHELWPGMMAVARDGGAVSVNGCCYVPAAGTGGATVLVRDDFAVYHRRLGHKAFMRLMRENPGVRTPRQLVRIMAAEDVEPVEIIDEDGKAEPARAAIGA